MKAPRDLAELLARARALTGRSVGELATELGLPLPNESRRGKGVAGALLEALLGATAGNLDLPDFLELGIELKTVPLDAAGRVQESTFVCAIDLRRAADEEWDTSRLWRKLQRVLWMPIEAASVAELAERRFGRPLYWEPDAEQRALLEADWTALIGRIAVGGIEELDATVGQVLQVRPKAANAAARVEAWGEDYQRLQTNPRGFYLRARFTEKLLWALSG